MTSDTTIPEHGLDGKLGRAAGRSDQGKNILHTIDPKLLMAWGDVLAFGASKYHQRNFMVVPGMEWSRVWDSLQRHLLLFWGGEWLDVGPNGEYGPNDDPKLHNKWSGLPHLGHVLCNIQFLWTYHENAAYHPGDDRPATVEYQGRKWEDWEREFAAAKSHTPAEAVAGPDIEELLEAAQVGAAAVIARIRDTDDKVNAEHRVKQPAFLRDPLRAYYEAKNRGETQIADEEPGVYGKWRGKTVHAYLVHGTKTRSGSLSDDELKDAAKKGHVILDAHQQAAQDRAVSAFNNVGWPVYLGTYQIPLKKDN